MRIWQEAGKKSSQQVGIGAGTGVGAGSKGEAGEAT